ncbi:MAG: FABP family protein [Acidobacteria bacterium]|nr:FABP family protein [Acidobacteriota bacterium]
MNEHKYPADIFTEPEDVDPDTLKNLGPLRPMAGSWKGAAGHDVNPKADGPEHNDYYETIENKLIDRQLNGPQLFYGMSYEQIIENPEEEPTFHHQIGFWLWEPATKTVIQTLAIPRGQIAMATGIVEPDATVFELTAKRGSTVNGICSNPFLEHAFKTVEYRCKITIHSEDSWSYEMTTVLDVEGRKEPFEHIDLNTMLRTALPTPNPLLLKVKKP